MRDWLDARRIGPGVKVGGGRADGFVNAHLRIPTQQRCGVDVIFVIRHEAILTEQQPYAEDASSNCEP